MFEFNPNVFEVHVATITEKRNGELLGASDVTIYTSKFPHEKEMWSEPKVLVDAPDKHPRSNKLTIEKGTLNL